MLRERSSRSRLNTVLSNYSSPANKEKQKKTRAKDLDDYLKNTPGLSAIQKLAITLSIGLKMAQKKIQKTFEDQNVPTKASSECQKLAIKYVQHLKEGCILLYSRFSIIVISFKNCRIHTKSSPIFEFFEQSVKNRNMSRFWKFIKQTLEIDENFVCLDSQNSYLFEHALSSVSHDIHLIKQIDEYDTRFKYGNRKRYTRVRIYIWFRSLLCNVFRSMLGTILSLIHTNCFRMNSNEHLSFVENLNFVKNIPYTYLNDPIVQYSGLAGVIHNHKMNLPSEYVFK